MKLSDNRRALGWLSAVIGLTILLAASLSQVDLGNWRLSFSGLGRPLSTELQFSRDPISRFIQAVFTFAIILFPLAILQALRTKRGRKMLFAWLIFIFVIAPMMINQIENLDLQPPSVTTPEAIGSASGANPELINPLEAIPNFIANPPAIVSFLLIFGLFGLVSVGLFLLWRRLRPVPEPLARVAEEVEMAIREIEAGGDFRSIILQCYAAMSDVLQRDRAIRRKASMTAREFETQLLGKGLPQTAVSTLTNLFEQARYATDPITKRGELEAIASLRNIEAACRRE